MELLIASCWPWAKRQLQNKFGLIGRHCKIKFKSKQNSSWGLLKKKQRKLILEVTKCPFEISFYFGKSFKNDIFLFLSAFDEARRERDRQSYER